MKKTIFKGSGVAIVTPMNTDGSVNFEKLGGLIEFQIAGGTDAIVICGTTGESSTLSHEEHLEAIKYTVQKSAGRIPVIAGTGSNDTLYALELTKEAQNLGADAALLVTPYYNKATQSGLVRHFTYIADRVNIPMVLYNIPSRTGVDIQPETYRELAKHPNIVAVKEANRNFAAASRTLALCGDEISVYSGDDGETLPLLALGAKGVISVLANIMPTQMHQLCARFFAGDVETARRMHLDLFGLMDALFLEVNPIPVKAALNLMGFAVGECRMPLSPMDDAKLNILKNEMIKHALIK